MSENLSLPNNFANPLWYSLIPILSLNSCLQIKSIISLDKIIDVPSFDNNNDLLLDLKQCAPKNSISPTQKGSI